MPLYMKAFVIIVILLHFICLTEAYTLEGKWAFNQ